VAAVAGLRGAGPGGARGLARAALLRALRAGRARRWDLAYAYEALARAHALARSGEAAAWKAKAREASEAIADPEDREHFDEDFETL
jgi:hypothetical protein